MNITVRLNSKWLGIPAWAWLGINLLAIGILTLSGPAEKSLGEHVRVVYLHGAWVWASLAGFAAAALAGLFGLVSRRKVFYAWSLALGRTGLLFWILYLPLSIWAMRTNWNGLFLAEPRWRLALAFAVSGLLLQVGLAILNRGVITALANVVFTLFLFYMLGRVENVMHPRSPIWESGVTGIQVFFACLLALTLLLGWQTARLWRQGQDI
jgi:hypothetical protein